MKTRYHMRKLQAIALCAIALLISQSKIAWSQAVQIPEAESCFQATTGIQGMIGGVAIHAGGAGGTPGIYTDVPLTGGSGSGAVANITVSSVGLVSQVVIYNPGINYVVGDVLSAPSAYIGGVFAFSATVSSISINSSLSGGSVGMYQPGTLIYSQTWQNASQTILNTNPIVLDQNGCAIIYGVGTYRQILYDNLGNEVWDQLTSVAPVNPYFAVTVGGTANAITFPDPTFASINGQSVQFVLAYTTTGPVSINGIQLLKNTNTGPTALVSGDLVAGNMIYATYNATLGAWILQVPTTPAASVIGATAGSATGSVVANNVTTPNTQIDITATSAILVNNVGVGVQVLSPTCTINAATNGANGLDVGGLAVSTWYYEWLIWNGSTSGCILSLSYSAPTLPTGYTYSTRVGAVKTDPSANFYLFTQSGNMFRWKVTGGTNTAALPIISNSSTGTPATPTWSQSLVKAVSGTCPNACAPLTADTISIIAGIVSGGSGIVMVAPNSSYGADNSTTNPPPMLIGGVGLISKEILLENYLLFYASTAGSNTIVETDGFIDSANVN